MVLGGLGILAILWGIFVFSLKVPEGAGVIWLLISLFVLNYSIVIFSNFDDPLNRIIAPVSLSIAIVNLTVGILNLIFSSRKYKNLEVII
jgi:hypothetical protein